MTQMTMVTNLLFLMASSENQPRPEQLFRNRLLLCAAAARSRRLVSRFRIGAAVVVIAQPADHHFFPGLLAPFHILRRIGVIFVALRVVEMGGAFDIRPFRNRER